MTSLQTASLDEMREVAADICRDYLTGRWKEVTAETIIVKKVSGGLSNFLYYVSLPEHNEVTNTSSSSLSAAVVVEDSDVVQSNVRTATTLETTSDIVSGEVLTLTDKNSNHNIEQIVFDIDICSAKKRQRTDSNGSAKHLQLQQKEPKEVLFRVYGQSHGEDALEAMITESVVFALLSERNFGPKLHGIFPGGRIEQYIPARPLKTLELSDHKISMKIAEKMGEIHSLDIPMSKEPDWIWNCMGRWLRVIPSILKKKNWNEHHRLVEEVRKFDLIAEIKWLKSIVEHQNYPVLFCHNDLQEGNILIRESAAQAAEIKRKMLGGDESLQSNNNELSSPMDLDSTGDSLLSVTSTDFDDDAEPDLIIIDFEYCAYNYRGFDLANHFAEWAIDYTNPEYPHYFLHKQQYPSKQQRRDFIVTYLKKLHEKFDDYEPTEEEVEGVQHEVRVFAMFTHYFWSLWSIVNAKSNIEFGYWEYAAERLGEYKLLKDDFINSGLNRLDNNND